MELEIFIDAHERNAETNGMRNSPSAGSHTDTSLQSVLSMKFHCG